MVRRICAHSIRLFALLSVALSSSAVHAQQTDRSGDTVQAIRELTAEIRSLRTAVEHAAQTQLQQHVLELYMTLQQSRVTQATTRLETVRRELERVTLHANELGDQAASVESQLMAEADPDKRRELELAQKATKQEIQRNKAQEQLVRTHESEAFQAAQAEESRWADLASQLEQLAKK
jgi:DNA integrity scanning protein DisA with diadenylate cyclase activity